MSITDDTMVTSVLRGDQVAPDEGLEAGSDLQVALDELAEACDDYEIAEQYYEDRRPEVFASTRLRRAMGRTSTAFHMGFAKKPVDTITERLTISSITSTNPEAQKRIDDLIKDNRLWRGFKNWFRRAGEYGDAYVIAWPSPKPGVPSGQLADTDDDGIENVDMFYNSPHCTRVFYDPENPTRKAYAVKKWVLTASKQVRVNLYYDDRIEKYITNVGVLHPKATDLKPYLDDDNEPVDPDNPRAGRVWPVPNPFGIPVFHFRNDEPYGTPEHRGFYGAQDAIRKLTLGHMASVDYNAFPQRWALADAESDATDLEADDDDMNEFALEDTGGTRNLGGEPQSQLSADPASVWLMKGYKGVGQFDAADPKVFTDPATLYLRMGAMITDTPLNRIDPSGASESGESRRIANEPFTMKCGDRQAAYGDTIKDLFEFVLNQILGLDDVEVTVNWAPVQSVEDEAGWSVLLLKLQAGLPVKQAFMEAGYTADQVKEWFGDEDVDLPIQVDLLLKIAQALAAFAPALGAGVISDEQVQAIISAVMGEWAEETHGDEVPTRVVPAPIAPVPPTVPAPEVTGDKPAAATS